MPQLTILTVVVTLETLDENGYTNPDVFVDSWQITNNLEQRTIDIRQKIKEFLGRAINRDGFERIVSVSHSIETQNVS